MNSRIVFDLSLDLIGMFVIECLQGKTAFPFLLQHFTTAIISAMAEGCNVWGGYLSGMTVS